MRTKDASEYFGGHSRLSLALGLSRMSVSHWGYWVPEKHAKALEAKSKGLLEVDKKLYSGKTIVHCEGKSYTPAIHVKSTALLGKHLANGDKLYFNVDGAMKPLKEIEGDVFSNFRIYPIYEAK